MPDTPLTYTEGNKVPSAAEIEKAPSLTYQPDPKERECLTRILRRIEQEMIPAQQPFHKEWDDARKIYEAYITPDPLKESFKIPLSHMVIDAALAEEIDAFPDIDFDTTDPDDQQKLPFLTACKKHALIRTNWDKVKIHALRIRRIYGFAPVRIHYRRETRMIRQRIPLKKDDGVEITYEETLDYPYDDIWMEVIDNPRRFLIGDNDHDVDEAADCALMTEVDWDNYRQKVQHDNRYKNVEYVRPQYGYGVDIKGEQTTPQQQAQSNLGKVKIYEYWNKYTDEYVVIANGVIIRETCLVDDHKELPFAVIHMYRRPETFYSKGIPKLIESIEAAYNAIMQAEVRATKLAFPILVTDDDNALDPRQIAPYPGVVLEGGLNKVDLKQLGSVPNEVYRAKDKLEELLIWTTGINFKQIFQADNVSQQRVGIEALKKESMLARVNANLRENEATFTVRLGNLLVQDIMQYYPVPKLRKIMPTEDVKEFLAEEVVTDETGKRVGVLEYRKIKIDGPALTEIVNKEKGLFMLKADTKKGRSYILARPEYIRTTSKLTIHAVRPSAMGSSKEAKKLMFLELADHAIAVNQAAMQQSSTSDSVGPDGNPTITPGKPIWDLGYIEEQIAEANDLPLKKAILSHKSAGDQADIVQEIAGLNEKMSKTMQPPTFTKAQFMQQPAMTAQGGQSMSPMDQQKFNQQL